MENKILAKVNGKEITQSMLDRIMQNIPPQQVAQMKSEEGQKRLLDEVVSGELLYFDAVDKEMDKEKNFIELLEDAKRSLLQRYAVESIIAGVSASDEDAKTYYESNSAQFEKAAEVSARHILVDDEEKIKDVKEEIEGGLDFAEAATKYSSCPSKQAGGTLGSFSKGKMVPEFEEAAFNLEIGQLSEPVKTQFGYHLIMVDSKTEAGTMSFEEVKDGIKQNLLNQKQFEAYNNKVAELKAKYTVEIL
ncbi:peptidyl-prolyl cis-trans isomerase C [Dethiosulfatibacter aminovorans DSM 17477]|uniref:Peptidyl-prolyl cis-trans isomerase C n=1 Tax=Dethiosulfatibacter aminovorans DSM 17477 TaxID=1121476 RepID=A0A1M6J6X1_9FIRM|nr:peptidylprolyl isomerase [Dethiosulfatibacter aminovorans]SHJ42463.1 peptidyl-prolyl cis-trans isomerase C [Dethiosulfatibacter aminovorans DSM 17477]